MIDFPCPKCRATLRAPEENAGATAKCGSCGHTIQVPGRTQQEQIPYVLPVEDMPASAPASASRQWHYSRGGQRFGPVADSEMRSAISRGELRRADLVWRPGLQAWEPASKHFDFPQDLARVRYNRKNDTFAGSLPAVMKLAIKALHRLGYRVANANESLGLVSFQGGMKLTRRSGQYSLHAEEVRENTYRIQIEGFRTGSNPGSFGGGFGADLGVAWGNTSGTLPEADEIVDEMIDLCAERK